MAMIRWFANFVQIVEATGAEVDLGVRIADEMQCAPDDDCAGDREGATLRVCGEHFLRFHCVSDRRDACCRCRRGSGTRRSGRR